MIQTRSVKLSFFRPGQQRRGIPLRMERRCGHCDAQIVVYRQLREEEPETYYCCEGHKNKASALRNGRRPMRGIMRVKYAPHYAGSVNVWEKSDG